jgi:competence protein ComEC
MCAIYLATRLLYRDRAMINALGAAALGLLVFDPRQLFTASFQMTFLCVLIVAAIGLPFLERTSQFYRQALAHWDSDDYGPSLLPQVAQFRVDLRLIAERLTRFLGRSWSLRLVHGTAMLGLRTFELLLVSAVMQMGSASPRRTIFTAPPPSASPPTSQSFHSLNSSCRQPSSPSRWDTFPHSSQSFPLCLPPSRCKRSPARSTA